MRAMTLSAAQELRAEGIHACLLAVDAPIDSPKSAPRLAADGIPPEGAVDMAEIARARRSSSPAKARAASRTSSGSPRSEHAGREPLCRSTRRILRRGDDGYEELRRRGHNALKPERYPELIVRPETEAEVVEAVRLARAEGLKVKARSGGHSWTASSVRDGMLIDLEALDEIIVDPDARTATVQPGVKGDDLGAALRAHGLFFPGGHCPTVCVGGYLLQGGFGWNGRLHGPACASVRR